MIVTVGFRSDDTLRNLAKGKDVGSGVMDVGNTEKSNRPRFYIGNGVT